jgi:hypothetical protein
MTGLGTFGMGWFQRGILRELRQGEMSFDQLATTLRLRPEQLGRLHNSLNKLQANGYIEPVEGTDPVQWRLR